LNKPFIKYFIILFSFAKFLFTQDAMNGLEKPINNNTAPEHSSINLKPISKISIIKSIEAKNIGKLRSILIDHPVTMVPPNDKNEEFNLNIVSSFRNNIKFGGFWEGYVIINFTPQVLVKPFDFISIYANHNTICFIPIAGITEHMKQLCIQGAAILAVDNSVKLIFGSNSIIPSIAGFTAKNIIISLLMKSINKNTDSKIYNNNSYYYSISIRL